MERAFEAWEEGRMVVSPVPSVLTGGFERGGPP